MTKRLVAAVLVALALSACGPTGTEEGGGVKRYVDDEYGIVCYWRYDASSPISCATMR